MVLETGDMWSVWGKTDLFCITTNSTVTKDGRLVMGRGIAQEARDSIRGLDARLGRMVGFNHRPYGLLILNDLAREKVLQEKFGAFQVKYSFSQPADLNLIRSSCACLFMHLSKNTHIRVDLNFPVEPGSVNGHGVGYGGLGVCEVWPIVSLLPDNVHLWCDSQTKYQIEDYLQVEAAESLIITQAEILEAIHKEEAKGIVYKTNNLTGKFENSKLTTSAVAKTDGNFGMERGVTKK